MLKAWVSKLEDVDEKYRDLYKKEGDGFALKVESNNGWEVANTTSLNTALQNERKDSRDAKAQVKELEKKLEAYGDISPEQAKTAIKSDATVEEKVAAGIKDREKQLIAQFDGEKSELNKQVDRYKSAVHDSLIRGTARAAIAEAKGNVHLLEPIVTSRMRLREEGENFVTEIVDDNGTPRIGGTANGTAVPLTLNQWIDELKKDDRYKNAFDSSGQSGSGADGGSGTGNNKEDFSSMTPAQKLEYGRKMRHASGAA